MKATTPLPFYSSCVACPRNELDTLFALIEDKQEITRRTFLKHVDREQLLEIADSLGYARHPSQGLTMRADWHIGYYRWKGCYFFVNSAIEYVFGDPTP